LSVLLVGGDVVSVVSVLAAINNIATSPSKAWW
jgi:hypothetical protein